jgi:hypothetical protein
LTNGNPVASAAPQTFNFERWRKHRSSSRYWRHFASLLQSNTVGCLAASVQHAGL